MLFPGQVIGNVEIVELLERRRNATTWRARHTAVGAMHLVEVLQFSSEEERLRAAGGLRRYAEVRSEYIPRLYDVISFEPSALVLVWDDAAVPWPGEPVDATFGSLLVEPLGTALAAALRSIYEAGLAHGGVRPDRVRCAPPGSYVPKLVYAPPALVAATPPDDAAAEDEDARPYLAPETIRDHTIDARSDVYALGATLWYFATGAPPPDAVARFEALSRGDRDPLELEAVPFLPKGREPFRSDLRRLLESVLALDPERRPRLGDLDARLEKAARMRVGSSELAEPVALDVTPEEEAAPVVDEQNLYDENVQFTVYRPKRVVAGRWYTMLAFAHLAEMRADAPPDESDPVEEVRRQAERVFGEDLAGQQKTEGIDSSLPIPREGEITFVPAAEGVEFNPPRRTFRWTESVHREEFRLRAASAGSAVLRGRLSVYLGNIIIADIPLAFQLAAEERADTARSEPVAARPYRNIFASYSHRDLPVVEQVERFAKLTGDRYLRDWIDLRAGEHWDERLRDLIRGADVFQLFWSRNSMASEFVEREWRYALSLGRAHFVRPVYWEAPLPALPDRGLPPDELRRLHFERLEIGAAAPSIPVSRPSAQPGKGPASIEPAPPSPPTPRPAPAAFPWGASSQPAFPSMPYSGEPASPSVPRPRAARVFPRLVGAAAGLLVTVALSAVVFITLFGFQAASTPPSMPLNSNGIAPLGPEPLDVLVTVGGDPRVRLDGPSRVVVPRGSRLAVDVEAAEPAYVYAFLEPCAGESEIRSVHRGRTAGAATRVVDTTLPSGRACGEATLLIVISEHAIPELERDSLDGSGRFADVLRARRIERATATRTDETNRFRARGVDALLIPLEVRIAPTTAPSR